MMKCKCSKCKKYNDVKIIRLFLKEKFICDECKTVNRIYDSLFLRILSVVHFVLSAISAFILVLFFNGINEYTKIIYVISWILIDFLSYCAFFRIL